MVHWQPTLLIQHLQAGGTNCTGITFSDSIGATTFSGAVTTAGLSLSGATNITLSTVAVDTTVLNNLTYTALLPTIALTLSGQTDFIYRTTNSSAIPQETNTVLRNCTVSNTGIYTICYCARYSGTGIAIGVQTWLYVSTPALYGAGGFGQLALNLVAYPSPYLNIANGVSMTGSWTGLVNAGATVELNTYIQYSGTTFSAVLLGGAGSNYLSITRIA